MSYTLEPKLTKTESRANHTDLTTELTIINLTLSQIPIQEWWKILLLSNRPHTIQSQINTKKSATVNKKRDNKFNKYFWNHGRNRNKNHTIPACNKPKGWHHEGNTLDNRMGESGKSLKGDGTHWYYGGERITVEENINYGQQNISLINTIPNISNKTPPEPNTNYKTED